MYIRVRESVADIYHLHYLNCTDNYDAVKIKVKSVTDHQYLAPKMCAILQPALVPSNPIPIVDHFRRPF